MALRAVIDHPKFARLKVLLKVNKSTALGYLECLWHFCGRYTPQGNIGKYTDADIEAWLEWDGEEGALMAALVKARWVDVHESERLVVHDWHKHADDATRLALKRAKLRFIGIGSDTVAMVEEACPDTVDTTSGLPEPEPEPDISFLSAEADEIEILGDGEGESKPKRQSRKPPDWFEAWFDRFKSAYPRRVGGYGWPEAKAKLLARFQAGVCSPEQVMTGVDAYRVHCDQVEKTGSSFVLMASTWVNRMKWCEDYGLTEIEPPGPETELRIVRRGDGSEVTVKFLKGTDEPYEEAA